MPDSRAFPHYLTIHAIPEIHVLASVMSIAIIFAKDYVR